jgi:hypothetical protein
MCLRSHFGQLWTHIRLMGRLLGILTLGASWRKCCFPCSTHIHASILCLLPAVSVSASAFAFVEFVIAHTLEPLLAQIVQMSTIALNMCWAVWGNTCPSLWAQCQCNATSVLCTLYCILRLAAVSVAQCKVQCLCCRGVCWRRCLSMLVASGDVQKDGPRKNTRAQCWCNAVNVTCARHTGGSPNKSQDHPSISTDGGLGGALMLTYMCGSVWGHLVDLTLHSLYKLLSKWFFEYWMPRCDACVRWYGSRCGCCFHGCVCIEIAIISHSSCGVRYDKPWKYSTWVEVCVLLPGCAWNQGSRVVWEIY